MMADHTEGLRVFYSYARPDLELRNEIEECLSTLKQQKYIVPWHDRRIRPGKMWKSELDGQLDNAHIILLLISPSYISSNYCYNDEMPRALSRHKAGTARAIPIILRPTDWKNEPFMDIQVLPTKAKAITTWENKGEALLDVASGVRAIVEELRGPFSSVPDQKEGVRDRRFNTVLWNIPYRRNSLFTGREELLELLKDRLIVSKNATFTQALALGGLGGIGKTQLAIEYAYRNRDYYRYIFWVNAAKHENIISGFVSIAQLLNLLEKDEEDQNIAVVAVKRWLTIQDEWLLILDDVFDMKMVDEFLPIGMLGHLILTTRSQISGSLANMIKVEEMDLCESMQLLLQRAKLLPIGGSLKQIVQNNQVQAEEIVKALGGVPLAIDQAGAYIEELGCSLADYLDLYHSHRKELLEYRSIFTCGHPESVTTTWLSLIQQVEQKNPVAVDLLRLCAFLNPDGIPEEIIIKGASEYSEALQAVADIYTFQKAISTLRTFSLLRREPDEKLLLPNRLLSTVLKDAMSEEIQHQWVEIVVRVINRMFSSLNTQTSLSYERLRPQALTCVNLIEQYKLTCEDALQVFNQVLSFDHYSQYPYAESLAQDAFPIRKQVLEPEHSQEKAVTNNHTCILSKDITIGENKEGQKIPKVHLKKIFEDWLSIRISNGKQ